ncbi:MAG: putative LPS assembly protein LptD, partial [Longimicrobiales bacterium]
MRRALLPICALLALAAASPVVAQQPDSVRTAAERIRERLRNIGPLIKDTTRADTLQADTLRADTLGPPPPDVEFVDSLGAVQPAEGLSGVTRDSVWQELLRLSGFVGTEYMADSALFIADSSRLDLRRAAEVVREGTRVQADTSIVFYQQSALACAYGNPVVSGAGIGNPVRSDSLCFDTDQQVGVAHGARTQVDQGGTWYVSGRPLVTVGEVVYTHDAIFTDCALDVPHYHFGAGMLKVVRNDIMVARDVTLRFGDVPVLWLPFFVQSLSRGRRSGLLTPRVSVNDIAPTSTNYARQIDNVGVYWAISDHLGAEAAIGWRSDDFTKLRSLFEYRFNERFLSGGVNFSHYWQSDGGSNYTINTNNSWRPDERTDVR